MINLTQKELAELCAITPRRVRQLVAEGTVAKPPDGRYTAESVAEYVQYVRRNTEKENSFRHLLEREKYRGLKRENDAADKLLAPVDVLVKVVDRGTAALIRELENLPAILKKHWPQVTEDHLALVGQFVDECRNILSEIDLTFEGMEGE